MLTIILWFIILNRTVKVIRIIKVFLEIVQLVFLMEKLLLLKERSKLIPINQIRISSFHLNQMHFQIPN